MLKLLMEDKIKEYFVDSMVSLMLALILLVGGNLGVRGFVMCSLGKIAFYVGIFLGFLRFLLLKSGLSREKNYQCLYTKRQARQF